jgi:hypothetical protein
LFSARAVVNKKIMSASEECLEAPALKKKSKQADKDVLCVIAPFAVDVLCCLAALTKFDCDFMVVSFRVNISVVICKKKNDGTGKSFKTYLWIPDYN